MVFGRTAATFCPDSGRFRKNEQHFADAQIWLTNQGTKMKHPKIEQQTSAVEHRGDQQLTDEQVVQVKKFIDQVGGVENARAAIKALEKLWQAA
jgi:hypothetical protein